LYDERIPAAVATVVESQGSTPRKPGSRMIVFPDGRIEGTVGGGALEKRVIEVAQEILRTGEPQLVPIELRENAPHSVGGVCGGALRVFIEPVGTPPRLLVFGAGHVGQTLAEMTRELDLQVVVYDDREEYAQAERFPAHVKVVCGPFPEAMSRLQPTSGDLIAIMTYQFMKDEQLLKDALETPARYIGMIGSELKCLRVMNDLKKLGVAPERLDGVHAPIGLPIGAHTPAEVAVSILAQIIRTLNQDRGKVEEPVGAMEDDGVKTGPPES
jgi:xanthine dehydrogenase accessory factor